MTIERLTELLKNHKSLSNSLYARKAEICRQIDAIWERCYPGGISYDKDRVISTPASYTEKLAGCAEASDRFKEELKQIEDQLKELAIIKKTVYTLSCKDQSILLKLYFDGNNIATLSITENRSRTTISSDRDKAIANLCAKLNTIEHY